MTVFTAIGSHATYAGNAVQAAGSSHSILSSHLFQDPAVSDPKGLVVYVLIGGNQVSGLPSTMDTASADPAESHCAKIVEHGWAVRVVSLPIGRGSANAMPTSLGTWIHFCGALKRTNVPTLVIDGTNLTGGGTYTISTVFNGSATIDEFQKIVVTGTVSGGTYTIGDGGTPTVVAWNASYATIQAVIEALPSIGVGNVSVSDSQNKTGNALECGTFDVDTWAVVPNAVHGPAYKGNGQIILPTTGAFTIPTGYTMSDGVTPATVHPARDPERLTSFMGMTMFCQWLMAQGAFTDKPRVLFAGSWGATSGMWATMGLSRNAYHFPGAAAGTQDAFNPTAFFHARMIYDIQCSLNKMNVNAYLAGVALREGLGGAGHYLDKQAAAITQGTAGTMTAASVSSYGITPGPLFLINRSQRTHLTASVWTDDMGGAPFSQANSNSMGNFHDGWHPCEYRTLYGPKVSFYTTVDPALTAPTTATAMATAGITPTLLATDADLIASRLTFLDTVYDEFFGIVDVPSDAPSITLAFGDFAPTPLWSQFITNLGKLARVHVINGTDADLEGSFDGETAHFWVMAAAGGVPGEVLFTRQKTRRRPTAAPILSGTVFLRGATANPTSGAASVSVVRT